MSLVAAMLRSRALNSRPAPRVEVAGRLVQDQQARLAGENARQAGAALLAVAQMMRGAVAGSREAYLRQGLVHPRLHLGVGRPSCCGPNATSSATLGQKS